MKGRILSGILFIILFSQFVFAQKDIPRLGKNQSENVNRTHFTINNLSTWIWANGDSDIDPAGNSGLIYPKGSGKGVVFETGLVWGGKVNGQIRVGGSTYRPGIVQGRIQEDGSAMNPNDERTRVYRVRPDWQTGDIAPEMELSAKSDDEIRNQYQLDWNEWPADWGAPYEDIDENGSYDPAVDIPGVPGSDQTIWLVANDLDETEARNFYGSPSMGIEMQATYWGYNAAAPLGNIMFRKYKIINKSNTSFEDMYLSIWSDIDLGGAGDDYVGCNPDEELFFSYNGMLADRVYGNTPPAVGFDFMQGPLVPSDNPAAFGIYNGEKIKGFENLPMTTFYFFVGSDPIFSDPDLGEYETGTLQFYRLFQGLISATGEPFTDPDGNATKFPLSGDVIKRTGWIDGILHPPGDRRSGAASGPFNMAAGETQEVVIAEIVAGNLPNVDNTGALELLLFYDQQAQYTYDNFFLIPEAPATPVVTVEEMDSTIILNWGQDVSAYELTEKDNQLEYKFEGYNIYQLPNDTSFSKSEAKLIENFDMVNGVGKIREDVYELETGVYSRITQYGNDNGISRTIEIKEDAFSETGLENGTEYYFAVTAYNYNSDATPKQIESPITIVKASPAKFSPQGQPSIERGEYIEVTHTGTGEANVKVEVTDPFKMTGHDYEIYFNEQLKYKDLDGAWKNTDTDNINLGKDLNGSNIDFTSVADYDNLDQFIVIGLVDIKSDVNSWADGVEITFPDGITILAADDVAASGGPINATPVIEGNKVTWGEATLSGWGGFAGGEELRVYIDRPGIFPMTVNYTIFDDNYGGNHADFTGSVVLERINPEYRLENHWNVKDLDTGQDIITDQTHVSGKQYFDSTWPIHSYGPDYGPEVDGIKVKIDGSYDAPNDLQSFSVIRDGYPLIDEHAPYSQNANPKLDFSLLTYGSAGWAIDGTALATFGNGTTSVELLQSDLEFRFTGVYEAPDANGVVYVKEGTGQVATLFRAPDMANHPMNPNPGSTEPFTVRIPFEVWDVERNTQINIVLRDRLQALPDGSTNFYAFNPIERMYTWILSTPYSEDVNDPNLEEIGSQLTWSHVWWPLGNWQTGDVVELKYANPIRPGIDKFYFTSGYVTPPNEVIPENYTLSQNYPNPFNPVTTIVFQIIDPDYVKLTVYDVLGQRVKELVNTQLNSGTHTVQFDGTGYASGVYFYKIETDNFTQAKKMMLLK